MPLATTQGFVLGWSPYNEQDRLVTLFTKDKGTLRAIAPGSLKTGNRFASLFELFTEGEFHYYWQENRELITISRGETIHSYFRIVSNPGNIFYFYLMADVLLTFIPFHSSDPRLYKLLNSILTRSEENIAIDLLLLYFLAWTLRIEGLMFNPRMCSNCNMRNLEQVWVRSDFRGILCSDCRTNESLILSKEELSFIGWTEKNSPELLESWRDRIDIAKLIRFFTRKIEFHGECTLKSSRYLKEFA